MDDFSPVALLVQAQFGNTMRIWRAVGLLTMVSESGSSKKEKCSALLAMVPSLVNDQGLGAGWRVFHAAWCV